MHLHGQFFKAVSRNGQPSSEQYFRNAILISPEKTMDISLVPFDIGTWMNHCHIVEHTDTGMMTSVIVQ